MKTLKFADINSMVKVYSSLAMADKKILLDIVSL